MLKNIAVIIYLLSLLACGGSEDKDPESEPVVKKVGSVAFTEVTSEITLNSVSTLQTSVASSTDPRPITYASSDEAIALIDAQGLITIQSVGVTTISATKIEDAEYLTVSDDFAFTILPAVRMEGEVSFSEIVNEVVFTTVSTLQTVITPSIDSRAIVYTSSDETIATIDTVGLITIKSMGITTISAMKNEDAEYFAANDNYQLTIQPPAIQELNISGLNELAKLSWSSAIEGSQYNLYLANESFFSLNSLQDFSTLEGAQLFDQIPINTLNKTIADLENNSPYFFIITAVNNLVESQRSIEVTLTPSAFNATTFTPIATNFDVLMPDFPGDYIDPNFNTKVIRLTDRASQSEPLFNGNGDRINRANAHPYPKTQVWNSDDTILRLHYRLFDANTLEELSITDGTSDLSALYYINGGMSEMKWSSVEPNVYYGISGSQFWKGTINREEGTIAFDLMRDFNEDSYDNFTLGKYEGNIDFNDEFVVFAARKTDQKHLTAIIYNIKTNQVIKKKEFENISWPDQGQVFDWLSISPHAGHILFSTNDSIEQYDLNLNKVRDLAASGGHGDLGIDQQGNEVYVQFEYGDNRGIWMYQLSDGSRVRLLPDKYNGGHISCRNYQRLGWCYASTKEENYKEIIAIRLDTSGPEEHEINRFVQTHASSYNPLGGVSPNGKSILFRSDWGDEAIHVVDKDSFLLRLK